MDKYWVKDLWMAAYLRKQGWEIVDTKKQAENERINVYFCFAVPEGNNVNDIILQYNNSEVHDVILQYRSLKNMLGQLGR